MLETLHPDAVTALVGGGLLAVHNPAMEANIGKRVRFTGHWTPSEGTLVRDHDFRIVGIQLDYAGRCCYRVVCLGYADSFGRVADPAEWTIIPEVN
jgi:hypothetical protein